MAGLRKTTPHVSRMTALEFETWPNDPSGQLWQLIDGEPVAMAPASQTHGAIQSEICALLRNHLRAHRSDLPGDHHTRHQAAHPRALERPHP